jgi:hypothetical protein
MKYFFKIIALLILGAAPACTRQQESVAQHDLKVILSDSINPANSIISYTEADPGGNTSLAFDAEDIYKWSGKSVVRSEDFGYFNEQGQELPYIKRDRDLGQTFAYTGAPKKLASIAVQLGFGTNVVRAGMYGKAMSLQIFEVSGEPVLHKNNSDTTEAFHGFYHDRNGTDILAYRDDYFTGETFRQLTVVRGATFPGKTAFGFAETDDIAPNDAKLKGKYLTFVLPEKHRIALETGKTYAFLILIDSIGKNQGFTLANKYIGTFPNGHGIRRDGDGRFPPVVPDPLKPFNHPDNQAAMLSAHFPTDFEQRLRIPPGTNGYPDVCTWRDLVFFIGVE